MKTRRKKFNDMERRDNASVKQPRKRARLDINQLNTDSEKQTINKLPDEILTEIFSYFHLHERKIARLVCPHWYQLLNIPLFLHVEKFICGGFYSIDEISTLLLNSKRQFLNIELLNAKLDDFPDIFWSYCGPRIHSIHLNDCLAKKKSLRNLLIHCSNLHNLQWTYEYKKPVSGYVIPVDLLDELIETNFTNQSVVSLELHLEKNGCLSDYIFQRLFIVLPNVKKLAIYCNWLDKALGTVNSDSKKTFTFESILNKVLSSKDEIEILRLQLHQRSNRHSFAWETIISHTNFSRLKEVNVEIDLDRVENIRVIDFFSKLSLLETIKCRLQPRSFKTFFSTFLSCLLRNCLILRHVQLMSSGAIDIDTNCFQNLVASRLETLCFQCRNIELEQSIYSMTITNAKLRTLHIAYGMCQLVVNHFICTFRNLKRLELHEVGDRVLQSIWKYQVDLVSLKLIDLEYITEFGITGECRVDEPLAQLYPVRYSIKRLKRLEYLEMDAVTFDWNVCDKIFQYFVLPQLRYLFVDLEGNTKMLNSLLEFVERTFSLEAVSITCQETNADTWIQISRKLPRLRYLSIKDEDDEMKNYSEQQYQKIFNQCLSLRVFNHSFNKKTRSYYADIFNHKVTRKTIKQKYRLASEKFGVFHVQWLWF